METCNTKTNAELISELSEMQLVINQLKVKETEHAGYEHQLAASEVRYRRLFETAQDGILILEAESGVITDVNPFLMRMLGQPKDYFLKKQLWEIGFFRDIAASQEAFCELQEKGFIRYEDLPLKTKDGRSMAVEFVSNVYGVDGDTVIQCNIRDITERKNAEELKLSSEKKYTELVNNITLGIFRSTTSDGGKILESNKAFEEITGYSREDSLSMQVKVLFVNPEERLPYISQMIKSGEATTQESKLIKKDGTIIFVAITSNPIKDREGHFLYLDSIIEDITKRKRAEEELKLTTQKLRELYEVERVERQELEEEVEARASFTNVLAHELRAPLTPIMASTGMLKELTEGKDDEIQKRLTENIYSSAQVLATRLEELLDMACYSRGTFRLMVQPTDFNRFVKDVIARFKPNLAMRQQCLIEDIQETIPLAEIDAPRLEQVIINLLSNASKFSQDQGTIAIRASIDSNHLQVDVRDCGIGITSESQKRVFEPYHKAEQDRQPFTGLGLGLAISKKIIEAHGGKIWLFSIPGQGSTFSFSIPIGLR